MKKVLVIFLICVLIFTVWGIPSLFWAARQSEKQRLKEEASLPNRLSVVSSGLDVGGNCGGEDIELKIVADDKGNEFLIANGHHKCSICQIKNK